jgi:hypothetical protein
MPTPPLILASWSSQVDHCNRSITHWISHGNSGFSVAARAIDARPPRFASWDPRNSCGNRSCADLEWMRDRGGTDCGHA